MCNTQRADRVGVTETCLSTVAELLGVLSSFLEPPFPMETQCLIFLAPLAFDPSEDRPHLRSASRPIVIELRRLKPGR